MIASAISVEPRGAAHLAGHNQQNLLFQSAGENIFDEGGDGMIDLTPHGVDPRHVLGAVAVGVIIPAAVRDGHESAAGLTQPTGQQQLVPQQVRGPAHVVPAGQFFHREQPRGVVPGDGLRVFPLPVERLGHPAGNDLERLLLVERERVHLAGTIGPAS